MLNKIKDAIIEGHQQETDNIGHAILTIEFVLSTISTITSYGQSENISKEEVMHLLQTFCINLDNVRNEMILNWVKQNEPRI